jgi:hypothetical protein
LLWGQDLSDKALLVDFLNEKIGGHIKNDS